MEMPVDPSRLGTSIGFPGFDEMCRIDAALRGSTASSDEQYLLVDDI